jgi:hypothetical protein
MEINHSIEPKKPTELKVSGTVILKGDNNNKNKSPNFHSDKVNCWQHSRFLLQTIPLLVLEWN